MPQGFARSGVERDEVPLGVAREHQPPCRRKHSSPRRRNMFPFPLEFASGGGGGAPSPPHRVGLLGGEKNGAAQNNQPLASARGRLRQRALLLGGAADER